MNPLTRWRAFFLATVLLVLSKACCAQDILVSDLDWLNPDSAAGEKLPVFKRKPKVIYPDSAKMNVQGYIIVTRTIAEDSQQLSVRPWASAELFLQNFSWNEGATFKPAFREKNAVMSQVWNSVIFNPRNAGVNSPDAMPRLLAVAPILMSQEKLSTLWKGNANYLTVSAAVRVGADGVLTLDSIRQERCGVFRDAINAVLPKWTIRPALKEGRPIETKLDIPFVVIVSNADLRIQPRLLKGVYPQLPSSLWNHEMPAEVVLRFIVSKNGEVEEVEVVKAAHPDLIEPAIAAVRRWKFAPSTVNGKPVSALMQLPIVFQSN